MKKIFSLVMAALLLALAVPTGVSADEPATAINSTVLEITQDNITNTFIQDWDGKGTLTKGTATLVMDDSTKVLTTTRTVPASNEIRDSNYEMFIPVNNPTALGNNKYFVVWADFSEIEYRKACFGLADEAGMEQKKAYRTDDFDVLSSFYYMADGSTEWQELSTGTDGCFGSGDTGSQAMKGMKGYFVFPIENFYKGNDWLDETSVIAGVYFYGGLENNTTYAGSPLRMSSFALVEEIPSLELFINPPKTETTTTAQTTTKAPATTTAPTTDPTTKDEDKGGCSGFATGSVAFVALMTVAGCALLKKKED